MVTRRARLLATGVGIVVMLPLAWLVSLSLARSWRYPALWPSDWQLTQWQAVVSGRSELVMLTSTSLALALAVGVCATIAGFLTSRALQERANAARWLAVASLPFAVAPVVYGAVIAQTYNRLGLGGRGIGVFLAQFPFAYGYAVLICHAYWTPHTRAQGELAHGLGATRGQRLRRVDWPLARGLLGLCLFQTALMSWFDFALVRTIGGGRVQTLTLAVFDYFRAGDLRLASASALLLIVPPALALAWNPALLLPATRHE